MDEAIFRSDIELAIHAAHRRNVRPEDVFALVCDRELLPARFDGQVHPATIEALRAVIQSIAHVATADDGLLWIATNHGDTEGLLVETEPQDEFAEEDEPCFLSPDLLARWLDAIPGTQIGIIATCYAGVFLPLANERRAMFAACGASDVYIVDYADLHPPAQPLPVRVAVPLGRREPGQLRRTRAGCHVRGLSKHRARVSGL